jgi:Excinuclease ATPase subunit
MRCERCHGAGKIAPIERIGNEFMQGGWVPCPDCGGCGIRHCCDGECIDLAARRAIEGSDAGACEGEFPS